MGPLLVTGDNQQMAAPRLMGIPTCLKQLTRVFTPGGRFKSQTRGAWSCKAVST
jgi:hypothetical protein